MTTQEFSIEFDILYNNLATNAAPHINAYEKSVFLTKAQSDIVVELYSGRNQLGLSFESNEEVREYLKTLITQSTWGKLLESAATKMVEGTPYYSVEVERPTDEAKNNVLFTIKEEIREAYTVANKITYKVYPVIPVTHDTLHNVLNNPFKGPKAGKRVLRLDEDKTKVTLYMANVPNTSYEYRETYLKYPSPIVIYEEGMEDLPIGYETVKHSSQECALPYSLHNMILERAVLLAKMAYVGGQTQLQQ